MNQLSMARWYSAGKMSAGMLMLGLATLVLSACGGSSSVRPNVLLLEEPVSAALGGTFMTQDGAVTVVVPPDALDQDGTLRIVRQGVPPRTPDNTTPVSDAFDIRILGAVITENVSIELAVRDAPQHPQVAEVLRLDLNGWDRVRGSFFRASESRTIGLTRETSIFRAVNRQLRTATGDGVARGQDVFLYETYENEDIWGGVIGLHELLNGLAPSTAVAVGAQIDLNRVPQGIVDVLLGDNFQAKQDALEDPAITRALIQADAVVGVRGFFDDMDNPDMMTSAGITCALCHVNVTPTEFELSAGELTPLPIGPLALDGLPNYDMNTGVIISLTPFVQGMPDGQAKDDLIAALEGWGPGRHDVRAFGAFNPLDDGVDNPTTFPPLWNFVDLGAQGYRYNWDGEFINDPENGLPNGLASQAEAVYHLVMGGKGAFGTDTGTLPPHLRSAPPQDLIDALVAAANMPNIIPEQDLLDVQDWQRSFTSPAPGMFDEALAEEGFQLFYGRANCGGCHNTGEFTGNVITAAITDEPPMGGLAGGIKTPGLRGIGFTAPYFHDGSAATLEEVVETYSRNLGGVPDDLTVEEIAAVAEYMRSL
ncbi:hypothetical protein K8B33_11755 [Alcanivorax sp. JB21]|uniref:c-type cytochrome n=1 Tax=Alcanivorax limicola TaxID=2874102 RepID=UPI001CBBAAE9|nr:c-type cytochrome [Alcanivorax limicola]MBZ2189776.1 hypothetical protein [Alcanivorax limicola]